MWGWRSGRFLRFGWAARFDEMLTDLTARLKAMPYALCGGRLAAIGRALRCRCKQTPRRESPNAGPVMASGNGSPGLSRWLATYICGGLAGA